MGNTETALKKSDLILEKSKGEVHEDWNISTGKLNGTPVTVFSAIHPSTSRKRSFMEKALQASKIYRHPGILRFVDGGLIEKEVVVVTEAATPLLLHGLEHMSALQITAGLASIIDALIFLHDKAGVSHNNVCASSFYITTDGTWKLWGLEYSCSFGDLTRDHIEKINQYCSERNLPPDEKNRISPAYQHSRDCYFLAKFFEETIAPLITIDIPFFDEFLQFIKMKALHPEWSERPRLSTFLSQPLFNHEFLQLRQNINNILLMSSTERENFIRELPLVLQKYPDDVVALTYGPLLLSHSFILIPSSAKYLMPCLLIPKDSDSNANGLFTLSVFKENIIPLILNLFRLRDAAIRKTLLDHFKHYVSLMPIEILTKVLLPQLLLGIRDTDDSLVVATLHCLAHLIPILGADTVVGKNREPIFSSTKPKIDLKDKVQNLKRKKRKDHQSIIATEVEVSADIKNGNNEKIYVQAASPKLYPDIPERSSPDGGEVTDEDVFIVNSEIVIESKKEIVDENWSDWEEMLDQSPPEIVGILQVKTPERGSLSLENLGEKEIEKVNNVSRDNSKSDLLLERRKSTSSTQSNISYSDNKGSAMQLKIKKATSKVVSQGLGEEYDIMSIKVEKKPDSELDYFADLMPHLRSKNYDLETMLIEASSKSKRRDKLPSLSDTLAELHSQGDQEGDAWNDEGAWGENDGLEDFSTSVEDQLKKDIDYNFSKPDISEYKKDPSNFREHERNNDNWNNSF